jgi:prevent-host-death family protein
MATRVIPKTELRDRIRDELAGLGEDSLLITERGRPLAVAVSVERWNSLQERIEDLEDRIAVLEHRSGESKTRKASAVFSSIERQMRDVPAPVDQAG